MFFLLQYLIFLTSLEKKTYLTVESTVACVINVFFMGEILFSFKGITKNKYITQSSLQWKIIALNA